MKGLLKYNMSIAEIILIGIALSMDAVAVTISNSMVYSHQKRKLMLLPVFFGLFQGIMPVFGFFLGSFISKFINKYSGIITLIILGFIGGKMVYDGIKEYKSETDEKSRKDLTISNILFEAVATSIDAFAVGVSFSAVNAGIVSSSLIICVTTLICSFIALLLGKKFGRLLGNKAEIFGGLILLIIGIKAVIQ